MVINHLLNGMILQVSSSNESIGTNPNGYLTEMDILERKKNPTGGDI